MQQQSDRELTHATVMLACASESECMLILHSLKLVARTPKESTSLSRLAHKQARARMQCALLSSFESNRIECYICIADLNEVHFQHHCPLRSFVLAHMRMHMHTSIDPFFESITSPFTACSASISKEFLAGNRFFLMMQLMQIYNYNRFFWFFSNIRSI